MPKSPGTEPSPAAPEASRDRGVRNQWWESPLKLPDGSTIQKGGKYKGKDILSINVRTVDGEKESAVINFKDGSPSEIVSLKG